MQLAWQMIKQKGQRIINLSSINHVVVVEHQDELARSAGDVIEQGDQNRFGWWWLRGVERIQQLRSDRRRDRLQCSDEVREKAWWVVLLPIQRQPRNWSPAAGEPCADQRGFPKAG